MAGLLRRVLRLGVLAGIGVAVVKLVQARRSTDPWADSWISTGPPGGTRPAAAPVAAGPKPPAAAPSPPPPGGQAAPSPSAGRTARPTRTGPARRSPTGKASDPPGERLWVPANDGVCPATHPVKAKLSSKIFHTPGSRNYTRTKADRCYPDEATAQADGLRPALR